MVKLFCVLVGATGSAFPVNIDASESVWDLKKAIKAKKPRTITCDADELELYVAAKGGGTAWLPGDDTAALQLENEGTIHEDIQKIVDGEKMEATTTLQYWLSEKSRMPPPSTGQIHVVVVVPPEEVCPQTGGCSSRYGIGDARDRVWHSHEPWLYEIIAQRLTSDRSLRRVLVVGSPGIGKSVFGVFLLLMFMTEKKDIAYRALDDALIYFNLSTQNGYKVSKTPLAGRRYVGLFDGNESGGALAFGCFHHAFLFASLRTKNYRQFAKEACFTVFMNPWTKAECQQLANAIEWKDPDEWERRFHLVGGTPRFVIASSNAVHCDRLAKRVQQEIPHNVEELKDQFRLLNRKYLMIG